MSIEKISESGITEIPMREKKISFVNLSCLLYVCGDQLIGSNFHGNREVKISMLWAVLYNVQNNKPI